jgi:hypothetical protein
VSKKVVVAALVAVVVAGLGLWGFVVRTDRGSDEGARKTAGAGAGSARDAAAQAGGLSSKEIQAVREGLQKSAAAGGSQGGAGDRPWPKEVAEWALRSCVSRAQSFVPPNDPGAAERTCACALQALRRPFPEGPPPPAKRKASLAYGRAEAEAIEECAPR